MLFTTKIRGATPATPHQARKQRNRKQPVVLCNPVMPESWEPAEDAEHYQKWIQRKGVAA